MLFAPFVKKKKDDAFSISADNMSFEIPRMRLLVWSEIWGS
jgi:hypothetical protein